MGVKRTTNSDCVFFVSGFLFIFVYGLVNLTLILFLASALGFLLAKSS
jgi:hypothetical protein